MINEKKIFTNLNADDSIRLIGQTEYLNMENMRIGANEFSRNGALQNIPSTQLLDTIALPAGDNLTIGRVSEIGTNRFFRFNYNSNGAHGIYCQDENDNITYIVLLSSQTVSGFNWSKSFRIDKNARVVNGLLEYTDNNNEPQEVNIEAGIKLNQPSYVTNVQPYATPVPYETLTLIKRPPIYPLQMTKSNDASFPNNYIQNNAYQFTGFYTYKNYETSSLMAYSPLAPYNAASETNNYILVRLSFSETIPDYVQSFSFCVKYGNTGKTFITKTFDKNNLYDRFAIESHNAQTVQLGISFFDNTIGIALDDTFANTSFDNVALKAKTLETGKNRAFLANVLKGYNTPTVTSLTASLIAVDTGTGGSYAGTWGYVTLHANFSSGSCQDTYMYPFVYVATGAPNNFYYFPAVRSSTIWNGGVGTVPGSVNLSDSSFEGNTEASMIAYFKATQYPYSPSCPIGFPVWQTPYEISAYDALGDATIVNFSPVSVTRFFKSSSDYEINIEFKDRFNRKCGVINTGITISIPARTFDQTSFTAGIQWALSNTDAIDQIPDWAYNYQIVIKKNQTTRFFEQIRATGLQYVTKNQNNTYTYGNSFTAGTTYATAIDLTALTNAGLGYVFDAENNDFAILILADETFLRLRVLGQDGNFVWLSPTDVGTGATTTIVFLELHTPYKPSITEPYFEVPNVYPISSPATINRAFSTLTDIINGDTYAIERVDSGMTDYIVEAMSPNDNVWQIWQTDTGFVNFVDTIGQTLQTDVIDFSDTYIAGTKVNGLNKFGALNSKNIGNSTGDIEKLQLTNKQTEDGTIMLIITEGDCLSAYLSEVQLVAAARNDGSPIQSTEVIGTINALKNGYGTINPESVVEYNGVVWWWDVVHGIVAQYSNDGVTVVSDYKLRRFADRWSKRYLILGKAAVEALCGFSYIDSCVDASTDEVFFMLPQVEVNAVVSGIPVGFAPVLPSYSSVPSYATSIQNRFDIYDGQPKIISFKYLENRWQTCYLWLPDCMDYLGSRLVGYKNGKAWLHNEDNTSFNVIYGVQYPQRICFTANSNPSLIRDVLQQDIEGNFIAPTFTVIYSESPNVQISDLIDTDYVNDESVLYATVFRDRISPNSSGTADEKLYKGDVVKSAYPLVMMEFTEYDAELIINFVDTQFDISRGHSGILPKPKN